MRAILACVLIVVVAMWLWLERVQAPVLVPSVPQSTPSEAPAPGAETPDAAATSAGAPAEPARSDASASHATAVSPAQPTLTLAGHIEQRFARLPWDDASQAKSNSLGNDGVLGLVSASKYYNPDRKQLTVEQSRALQATIDEFALRKRAMLLEEGRLSKAAFMRAARAGQIESYVPPPVTSIDPALVHAGQPERDRLHKEVMDGLSGRLGKEMKDWAQSTLTTLEPDGIGRVNIVYITKQGEPEVFAIRAAMSEFKREMQTSYRDFFQRL